MHYAVEQAYAIDKKNGNTLWRDEIEKEMYNIGTYFDILEEGDYAPKNYNQVSGNLISDVKMDFTRKARYNLDSHMTPTP